MALIHLVSRARLDDILDVLEHVGLALLGHCVSFVLPKVLD